VKNTLMIIGGIVVGVVFLFLIVFGIISATSNKLVCKSDEGNITIMYNKENITGYTAKNITYDLEGQKEIAKKIGIKEYLNEFTKWFETNTTGTCKKNNQ